MNRRGIAIALIARVNDAAPSLDHGTDRDTHLRSLVLGYLDEHPTAMDTLDGIAEWWVLRQQIQTEVRRVSRVLSSLVRDGILEEHVQGGIRFYRRANAARDVDGAQGIGR